RPCRGLSAREKDRPGVPGRSCARVAGEVVSIRRSGASVPAGSQHSEKAQAEQEPGGSAIGNAPEEASNLAARLKAGVNVNIGPAIHQRLEEALLRRLRGTTMGSKEAGRGARGLGQTPYSIVDARLHSRRETGEGARVGRHARIPREGVRGRRVAV